MERKFWIRLGVAILIALLLWWLYVAVLWNEDETESLSQEASYSSSIRQVAFPIRSVSRISLP